MSLSQFSHVRQKATNDCVIATVAAIANMPLEAVYELNTCKLGKRGLHAHAARQLLQKATKIRWRRPRPVMLRRLGSLCCSKRAQVLFIRPPGYTFLYPRTQHCIFAWDGFVFDPDCNGAILATEYDRINWIPTVAFFAVDYRKLSEVQRANKKRYRQDRLYSAVFGG